MRNLDRGKAYVYNVNTGDSVHLRVGRASIVLKEVNGKINVLYGNKLMGTINQGENFMIGRNYQEYLGRDVSREHLEIFLNSNGEIEITDLGSTYGTEVVDHER